MDKLSRKELTVEYKNRKITGGVFAIKNSANGMIFLHHAIDLQGSKNRFEFSKKTGSCGYKKLQEDFLRYGPDAFTFEVIEELEKDEAQTQESFVREVQTLYEMLLEKTDAGLLY